MAPPGCHCLCPVDLGNELRGHPRTAACRQAAPGSGAAGATCRAPPAVDCPAAPAGPLVVEGTTARRTEHRRFLRPAVYCRPSAARRSGGDHWRRAALAGGGPGLALDRRAANRHQGHGSSRRLGWRRADSAAITRRTRRGGGRGRLGRHPVHGRRPGAGQKVGAAGYGSGRYILAVDSRRFAAGAAGPHHGGPAAAADRFEYRWLHLPVGDRNCLGLRVVVPRAATAAGVQRVTTGTVESRGRHRHRLAGPSSGAHPRSNRGGVADFGHTGRLQFQGHDNGRASLRGRGSNSAYTAPLVPVGRTFSPTASWRHSAGGRQLARASRFSSTYSAVTSIGRWSDWPRGRVSTL